MSDKKNPEDKPLNVQGLFGLGRRILDVAEMAHTRITEGICAVCGLVKVKGETKICPQCTQRAENGLVLLGWELIKSSLNEDKK